MSSSSTSNNNLSSSSTALELLDEESNRLRVARNIITSAVASGGAAGAAEAGAGGGGGGSSRESDSPPPLVKPDSKSLPGFSLGDLLRKPSASNAQGKRDDTATSSGVPASKDAGSHSPKDVKTSVETTTNNTSPSATTTSGGSATAGAVRNASSSADNSSASPESKLMRWAQNGDVAQIRTYFASMRSWHGEEEADVRITALIDAQHDDDGDTPLIAAARKGHLHTLQLFLEEDGDFGIENDFGRTALHAAAMSGHCEACLALLRFGAEPSVRDRNDCTPFDRAVISNQKVCAVVLAVHGAITPIDGGADGGGGGSNSGSSSGGKTSINPNGGKTSQSHAAILSSVAAFVNEKSPSRETALSKAVSLRLWDMAALLVLGLRANASLISKDAQTTLRLQLKRLQNKQPDVAASCAALVKEAVRLVQAWEQAADEAELSIARITSLHSSTPVFTLPEGERMKVALRALGPGGQIGAASLVESSGGILALATSSLSVKRKSFESAIKELSPEIQAAITLRQSSTRKGTSTSNSSTIVATTAAAAAVPKSPLAQEKPSRSSVPSVSTVNAATPSAVPALSAAGAPVRVASNVEATSSSTSVADAIDTSEPKKSSPVVSAAASSSSAVASTSTSSSSASSVDKPASSSQTPQAPASSPIVLDSRAYVPPKGVLTDAMWAYQIALHEAAQPGSDKPKPPAYKITFGADGVAVPPPAPASTMLTHVSTPNTVDALATTSSTNLVVPSSSSGSSAPQPYICPCCGELVRPQANEHSAPQLQDNKRLDLTAPRFGQMGRKASSTNKPLLTNSSSSSSDAGASNGGRIHQELTESELEALAREIEGPEDAERRRKQEKEAKKAAERKAKEKAEREAEFAKIRQKELEMKEEEEARHREAEENDETDARENEGRDGLQPEEQLDAHFDNDNDLAGFEDASSLEAHFEAAWAAEKAFFAAQSAAAAAAATTSSSSSSSSSSSTTTTTPVSSVSAPATGDLSSSSATAPGQSSKSQKKKERRLQEKLVSSTPAITSQQVSNAPVTVAPKITPVQAPIQAPIQAPVQAHVQAPVQAHVQAHVQAPVRAHIKVPVAAVVPAVVSLPVAVAAPVAVAHHPDVTPFVPRAPASSQQTAAATVPSTRVRSSVHIPVASSTMSMNAPAAPAIPSSLRGPLLPQSAVSTAPTGSSPLSTPIVRAAQVPPHHDEQSAPVVQQTQRRLTSSVKQPISTTTSTTTSTSSSLQTHLTSSMSAHIEPPSTVPLQSNDIRSQSSSRGTVPSSLSNGFASSSFSFATGLSSGLPSALSPGLPPSGLNLPIAPPPGLQRAVPVTAAPPQQPAGQADQWRPYSASQPVSSQPPASSHESLFPSSFSLQSKISASVDSADPMNWSLQLGGGGSTSSSSSSQQQQQSMNSNSGMQNQRNLASSSIHNAQQQQQQQQQQRQNSSSLGQNSSSLTMSRGQVGHTANPMVTSALFGGGNSGSNGGATSSTSSTSSSSIVSPYYSGNDRVLSGGFNDAPPGMSRGSSSSGSSSGVGGTYPRGGSGGLQEGVRVDAIGGGVLDIGGGGMNHITSFIDTILASSSSSESQQQQMHSQHPSSFLQSTGAQSSFVSSSFGVMPTIGAASTSQGLGGRPGGVVSSSLMPQQQQQQHQQHQQLQQQQQQLQQGGHLFLGREEGPQMPVRSSLLNKW